MDEEEQKKIMEQEWKDKIEFYEQSKQKIARELEGKEGRDKEAVQERMKSCDRLIDNYRQKLNPTGKKEMYK